MIWIRFNEVANGMINAFWQGYETVVVAVEVLPSGSQRRQLNTENPVDVSVFVPRELHVGAIGADGLVEELRTVLNLSFEFRGVSSLFRRRHVLFERHSAGQDRLDCGLVDERKKRKHLSSENCTAVEGK